MEECLRERKYFGWTSWGKWSHVSTDGNHVYVTSLWDKAIGWYERNSSTGSLAYIGMLKEGRRVDGLEM